MRKLLAILACILAPGLYAGAVVAPLDNIPVPSDAQFVRSLNGVWTLDFNGRTQAVPVPGCWDALGLLEPKYAHPEDVEGIYRHSFEVPQEWMGSRIFLQLDGVLRGYELSVNGESQGCWEMANNSAQFDITGAVRPGANDLDIRVYTRYKGYEFDGNDDWGPVGIHRDVTLFAVPEIHLKDIRIGSRVAADGSAVTRFGFEVAGGRALIEGRIVAPDGREVRTFTVNAPDGRADYEWAEPAPELWTAETPSLYTLEYRVLGALRTSESLSCRFGVREVRVDGARLLVNNRPVKLRGVNVHAQDPRTGKAISEETNLLDMRLMKECNVNFIRNCHYPREPRFYELCDSLGFYVEDEVPFGYGDEHLNDASYQDVLLRRAEATVVRDKNHPCVIIWGIGNENNLTKICEVTGQRVKELDPTRPICYPQIGSYFHRLGFDLPDFIDVYAPHYPSAGRVKEYSVKSTKPIIFTEYNHTLGQALEDHHELWELMQASDNIAGGAVWEWQDQGMPDSRTVYPGKFAWTDRVWISETDCIQMEGDQGTDGILYADRVPLSNYYNVRKNYAQIYVLTDSLTAHPGRNEFGIEVQNRFDFVNLEDRVDCIWTIESGHKRTGGGTVTAACAPHGTAVLRISAGLRRAELARLCTLRLRFVDRTNGLQIGERTFVLNSSDSYASAVASLRPGGSRNDASGLIDGCFWRSGRKRTIADDRVAGRNGGKGVEHYLLRVDDGGASNGEISWEGSVERSELPGGALRYDFNMAPAKGSSHIMIREAGLALLLDSSIDCFQWLGRGPYTAWPGKDSANEPGVHALKSDDLYFEGNKRGVDALLCTDSEGGGLFFVSDCADVDFELTDRGVVLSFNPVVSGLGAKGSLSSYSNFADSIGEVKGSVTVYRVEAGRWNKAMKSVFSDPADIEAFTPYLSQYDTYRLTLDGILGR